ncbi:hypothetical protein AAHZ94_22150 [Streptomyces sp. HSW2009]|uniref:hypothetical protein n=1 Tax=Streptomyces sp. HSW2009 TaxID=3142890 RepID=UPI0032EC737A
MSAESDTEDGADGAGGGKGSGGRAEPSVHQLRLFGVLAEELAVSTPAPLPWSQTREVEIRRVGADSGHVVRKEAERAELTMLLAIDPAGSTFTCMCWGEVEFVLRDAAGAGVALLRLHVGVGLDWHRWGGPLPLLHPTELLRWLADRGVDCGA